MDLQGQIGIYFHWPFCLSKCPYCDFNVHVRESIDTARWLAGYLQSLEYYQRILPDRIVRSVYFGGGTPSLMPPDMVGQVIDKIRRLWPQVNDCEITLEANPTSIEAGKFRAFKEGGVNRVSIGVQALNDPDLQFFGRGHSRTEALSALEIAQPVFERFSFDLIYARPAQSLAQWEAELREAVALAGGHLSLYQLTIERNTPFYFDHAQGRFHIPDDDLAADFYLLTQRVMEEMGLPLYEVSNHAQGDTAFSQHNLQYWRSGDYIGIGPGAHGRITLDGRRYATRDHHAPDHWLSWVEEKGCGAHPFDSLSVEDQVLECLMMGLRLAEGLPLSRLERIAGQSFADVLDVEILQQFEDQEWLIQKDGILRLTVEGMLRLNALIPRMIRMPRRRFVTAG